MEVVTEEQRNRRVGQWIIDLKNRIRRKGDSAFRKVVELTGDGDYLPGFDDGEPPVR